MSDRPGIAVVSADEAARTPYPYVWVNEDLSARELHPEERRFLETPFTFGDGARPYVKSGLSSKDGWKRLSGFCHRKHLRRGQPVLPAPTEDPNPPKGVAGLVEFLKERDPGIQVLERDDGTMSITFSRGRPRNIARRLIDWLRGGGGGRGRSGARD